MKRTKEDAEITKNNILSAALDVFVSKGYRATRLDDVAAEANVTRGAIYWHFKNKYELFKNLMTEYSPDPEAYFKDVVASEESVEQKIYKILIYFLRLEAFKKDYKHFYSLVQIVQVNREELSELHETLVQRRKKMTSMISGIIRDGIVKGEISSNTDPDVTAYAIFSYASGILIHSTVGEELDLKDLTHEFAKILLTGIIKR